MLRLRTFAALDLTDAGGSEVRAVLRQPKRFALLVYLAVARPGCLHRRDSLLPLFWPELNDSRARHALSQALHVLRREVGSELLASRGDEEVGIDGTQLWCDAVAFEELLEAGESERALELYGGSFLTGFHLTHAPDFGRWADEMSARFRQRASAAASERATHYEAVGALAEAARWVRLARRASPLDERLTQDLIRLLDRVGDRAQALDAYQRFATLLEAEVGVMPSPETQRIVAQVRARSEAGTGSSANPRVSTHAEVEAEGSAGVGPGVGEFALDATRDEDVLDVEAAATERWPVAADRAQEGTPRTARWRYGVGFVGVAALVGLAMWVARTSEGMPLDPTKVLVGGFGDRAGSAGAAGLAELAADGTIQSLARSGIATPISVASVDPDWTEASVLRPSASSARLRSLARRAGAGTIVWGLHDRVGDSVRMRSEIVDVESGRTVDAVEVRVGPDSDPSNALVPFRQRVTGAVAALIDPRFAEWKMGPDGSPSFDAYLDFVRGVELYYGHDGFRSPEGAIERFDEASRLDPRFLTPRVWTVLACHYMGETAKADSIASWLAADADRLALTDRYVLNHFLAAREERRGKALDEIRKAMILSPRAEYMPLAVLAALEADRPREAVRWMTQADTVAGWASHWGGYSISLAWALHALGDHDLELEPARRARVAAPGNPYLLHYELDALAAMAHPNLDARLSEVLDMELTPYAKGDALCEAANELVGHGHRVAGAAMLNRCIQWDLERAEAGGDAMRLSWSLIFAGRFDEARPYLEELAEARPNNLNVIGPLATLEAAQGNRDEAERLDRFVEAHQASSPYWEKRKLYWRAAIATRLGDQEAAVRLLAENVGEGRSFRGYHADLFFETLWSYPPFALLMEPTG
jgi:serine/threonine-protein kinase